MQLLCCSIRRILTSRIIVFRTDLASLQLLSLNLLIATNSPEIYIERQMHQLSFYCKDTESKLFFTLFLHFSTTPYIPGSQKYACSDSSESRLLTLTFTNNPDDIVLVHDGNENEGSGKKFQFIVSRFRALVLRRQETPKRFD